MTVSRRTSGHLNRTFSALSHRRQPLAGIRHRLSEQKYLAHPFSTPLSLTHPLLRALDFFRSRRDSVALHQILAQLLVCGLLFHPYAAGRALLALSSVPSSLPLAVSLFFILPHPDAFAANTLIRSFLAVGLPAAANTFYRRLVLPAFVAPNHFTFPLLSKLFSRLNLPLDGQTTHARITKLGFASDVFVSNSLLHMYASFGDIVAAEKIFLSLDAAERDMVTYNTMIDGYVKNEMLVAARKVFDEMPERDVVSWNAMIAGYVGNGNMDAGRELFWLMPERDIVSWNTMIDGHAKIGEVSIARELFDSMPERNLVSWNVMLALYTRVKCYRECLDLFDLMIFRREAKPNEATFVSVLTACANLGKLDTGKWIHSLIRAGSGEPDVLLWTALMTMYAKCGAIELAKKVFDEMPERNTVSWNSMIMSYGLHGQTNEALELFTAMERSSSQPNEATFVCILSACAQSGSVLEGFWCFRRMVDVHNMKPSMEHFGCLVDLLGRSGLLQDSAEFVEGLTEMPTKELWGALMSSCWNHSNWEIGKFIGKKLIETMPEEVGSYILLSNIWAAEGNWVEVEKVRKKMKEKCLQKDAGVSLLGVDNSHGDCLSEAHMLGGEFKKRMLYSLLKELGGHLKASCTESDDRRESL
ncbi:Pentatricopeptide repeat-containing protein [Apostasia shenzhenica]|uniref:Pentatricopeptide repeat-containing protein n=1 Tax=Apostasia shenzhenica TaxID=1088818 RepID=A0A2H9ZQT4_9ASPA|nr:Pentatricopeptide repeat-containing protein [Apostasia shenzhenica]